MPTPTMMIVGSTVRTVDLRDGLHALCNACVMQNTNNQRNDRILVDLPHSAVSVALDTNRNSSDEVSPS